MKGEVLNGTENGVWSFYDEDEKLVQQGSYQNGIPVGLWKYDFSSLFDTTIIWQQHTHILKNFTFSLPQSFRQVESDSDSAAYTVVDSKGGDVFTIRTLGNSSQTELENYFIKSKEEFGIDFNILNSSSTLVESDSDRFFLDKFLVSHKQKGIVVMHYNLYKIINNDMVILSYTSAPQDSVKAKFLVGETFYHSLYGTNRIMSPFIKIQNVINR
jgi:hypothetical protein